MSDYYVFCIIGFNGQVSDMKEEIIFEAESNYYLILWSRDCGKGRSLIETCWKLDMVKIFSL